MKTRTPISLLCLVMAILALAHHAAAQRARLGKITALQATRDKAGDHPATTSTDGPRKITCLNGVSETPNVVVSCYIVAPGFKGTVNKGQTIDVTDAGTVTLTCHGQGFLRCDARVASLPAS